MLALPTKHVLKALLHIAEKDRGDFTPVSELAKAAGVPPSYLSKLVKQLARTGLLDTRKGPKGGVALPRKKVSFYEVCEALNDPVVFESCFLSKKACSLDSPCPVHSEWSKERARLQRFLKKWKV